MCTLQEFFRLVEAKGTPPKDGRWWRGSSARDSYTLPTTTRRCPICGQGWDITNFWDVHVDQDFADFPLDEFVGKTLHEVGQAIADRPEASYCFHGGETHAIRPTGVPHAKSLYREEGNMICGPSIEEHRAWVAQHKAVPLDYVISPDDAGGTIRLFRYQSYHRACYGKLGEQERAAALQEAREVFAILLKKAGFSEVSVESVLPPQALIDQMKEGLKAESDADEECTPETVAKEMPYFAVRTLEGAFGIMLADIPMIDLSPTPLTPKDFGIQPEQLPPGFPLVPIDEERGNLRLLRRILLGKRKKRKRKK